MPTESEMTREATPTLPASPEPAQPQEEHRWLQRLVGEWGSAWEALAEPGQPPMRFEGRETVRSLGGLWVVAEGRAGAPGGEEMTTITTLGYDPRKGRFVGTFIASMMTHLWVYQGVLDAERKILTLAVEGPNLATGGDTMALYEDAIAFESEDHRVLTSRMLGDDGEWHKFMTAHYRRRT